MADSKERMLDAIAATSREEAAPELFAEARKARAEHRRMGAGKPKRIQRQRTKGWRMPEGAIYVGRPYRHANPFRVVKKRDGLGDEMAGVVHPASDTEWYFYCYGEAAPRVRAAQRAVDLYRDWIEARLPVNANREAIVSRLGGFDLACWCPLEDEDGTRVPCHADVLLEIANEDASPEERGF